MNETLLDKFLVVLILLFVLSVITEKTTSFIRKYPKQCQVFSTILSLYLLVVAIISSLENFRWWFAALGVLCFILLVFLVNNVLLNFFQIKSDTLVRFNPLNNVAKNYKRSTDDTRSKEISLLSILTGITIAFIFQADLIQMFKSGEAHIGTWDESLFDDFWHFKHSLVFSFQTLFGILMAGFFLSFGSKFFHDLLDNLIEVKNMKRNLNDSLEKHNLKQNAGAVDAAGTNRAILLNIEILKKLPGFLNANVVCVPSSAGNEYFASLNFSGAITDPMQKFIEERFSAQNVPIKIFQHQTAAKVKFGKINKASTPKYVGTICCPLIDDNQEVSLLTCAHVLTSGNYAANSINETVLTETVDLKIDGPGVKGVWFMGFQDSRFDLALISLKKDIPPTGFVALQPQMTELGLKVFFQGTSTPFGSGTLFAINEQSDIAFENETIPMTGLLKITNHDAGFPQSIALGGDSGALLFDGDNRAVGMILASTTEFTFAIALSDILSKLNQQRGINHQIK